MEITSVDTLSTWASLSTPLRVCLTGHPGHPGHDVPSEV